VKIAGFVIPAANSIRVVSADIAKNIRSKFPNIKAAVFVLPVFVNLSEFENAQKSEKWTKIFSHFKFVILMVSRLSPEKKIETALRAVSQLVATYNFLGLAIAGDGIEKDRLEKMAENLGISQNVMFLGWQDNPASLFKSADVFLSTSAFEGYGMALLEAASAGCPIVSTNAGLAKEMCRNGENSFVCPVDDDNCVAEAISRLIQNEGLRLGFSREMSKESAKHSISENDYVNRYIEELTRLVPLDNQSQSIQK
jgi:glycosyltransferase involved in cell wall biosynthesis